MKFAKMPPREEQQFIFDYLRSDIDFDLRQHGIDELIERAGSEIPDPKIGVTATDHFDRLVVTRHRIFTTEAADIDRDLDPVAGVMAVEYEVGVRHEMRDGLKVAEASYMGYLVTQSVLGGPHEAAGIGLEMSGEQRQVVINAVNTLFRAKSRAFIPYLTKSLVKIGPAGD